MGLADLIVASSPSKKKRRNKPGPSPRRVARRTARKIARTTARVGTTASPSTRRVSPSSKRNLPGPSPRKVRQRSLRQRARAVDVPTRDSTFGLRLPSSAIRIPTQQAEERESIVKSIDEAKAVFDTLGDLEETPGILARGPGGSLLYELGIVDDEDLDKARTAVFGSDNPGLWALPLPGIGATKTAGRIPGTIKNLLTRGDEAIDVATKIDDGAAIADDAFRGAVDVERLAADVGKQATGNATRLAYPAQWASAAWKARRGLNKSTPIRNQARWLADFRRAKRGKTPLGPRAPIPRRAGEGGFATKGALLTGTGGGALAVGVGSEENTRNFAAGTGVAVAGGLLTPQGVYNSGRQLVYAALGTPAAIAQLADATTELTFNQNTAPLKEMADMLVDDIESRYTPFLEGNTEQVWENVTGPEGTGITPYAFDVAIFGTPAGRVAGNFARQGSLGKGLQSFATRARPKLLTEVGETAVPATQAISKNLFGVTGQRLLDRRRSTLTERRATGGRFGNKPREGIAVEAMNRGAIMPWRQRNVVRGMNEREGRARERKREDQRVVIQQGILKDAYEFLKTPRQREIGVKLVMAIGAKSNPEDGKAVAYERIKQITRDRERDIVEAMNEIGRESDDWEDLDRWDLDEIRESDPTGESAEGRALLKIEKEQMEADDWDNIQTLNQIIEHADEIFTPDLQQFVDQQIPRMRALGILDPSLTDERLLLREQADRTQYMRNYLNNELEDMEHLLVGMPKGHHHRELFEEIAANLKQRRDDLDRRDINPNEGDLISDADRTRAAKKLRKRKGNEGRRGRYMGDFELTHEDVVEAYDEELGEQYPKLTRDFERNMLAQIRVRPLQIYELALAKAKAVYGDEVKRVNLGVTTWDRPNTGMDITKETTRSAPTKYPGIDRPIRVTVYKDIPDRRSESRASQRKREEEYDPTAAGINARPWTSGMVAPRDVVENLTGDQIDPNVGNPLSLVGPGAKYTTSKVGTGKSYAGLTPDAPRRRDITEDMRPGTHGIEYDLKSDDQVLDLEAPFNTDNPLYTALMNAARTMDMTDPDDPYRDLGQGEGEGDPDADDLYNGPDPGDPDETPVADFVEHLADSKGVTGIKAYDAMRQEIAYTLHAGIHSSLWDAGKIMEQINADLRGEGIDVLTHKGGSRRRTPGGGEYRPHQVVVALDPNNFWNVDTPNEGNILAKFEHTKAPRDPDAPVEESLEGIPERNATFGPDELVPEPLEDYFNRLDHEAGLQNLNQGAYFPSRMPRTTNYSAFGLGTRKAMARAKRWKGELSRRGIEDYNVSVLMAGAAENIKRFHNWNLMSDLVGKLAFRWSTGEKGEGMTIAELLKAAAKNEVDEDSFTMMNMGILENRLREMDLDNPASILDDSTSNDPLVGRIIAAATAEPPKYKHNPEDFDQTTGWVAVPKRHADELLSTYKSTAGGRMLDIMTTQQSRLLLATLNIPWLQFQVMSNAILTGLVAHTGPLAMIQAQRWWKSLPEEQRRAVSPYIGNGHFALDARKPMMGKAGSNEFINSYRALKETMAGKVIWKGGEKTPLVTSSMLNPLNVMFGLDTAQNNFFRRAIFYKEMRKDAWESLGQNTSKLGMIQQKLMRILELDPDDQMKALLSDKGILEVNAKTVSDWLGDYTRFTAFERNYLKRNVMFYGFLRFSLRLAFWTLPMKHPMMTGLLYQFSQLKVEEAIELLGGDELPYALGRIYSEDGQLMLDFARANPLMNALNTNLLRGDPIGALGFFPPMYGAMVGWMTGTDPFTGKKMTVDGETVARASIGLGVENTLEIFARQGLRLYYPYRVYEEYQQEGRPVTSDSISLPFGVADPNFKQYVRPDVVTAIDENAARFQEAYPSFGDFFETELNPFQWKESQDKAIAQALREREEEERQQLGLSGTAPVGTGSGGMSSGFGGGTFGGSGFGD